MQLVSVSVILLGAHVSVPVTAGGLEVEVCMGLEPALHFSMLVLGELGTCSCGTGTGFNKTANSSTWALIVSL